MTKRAPSILSVSYDEPLLHTRQWILETAGFNVISALGFTEAITHCKAGVFDLLIIGHSIPPRDKAALVKVVRDHDHTRVLALLRAGEMPLAEADLSIDAWEGPDVLLTAVQRVLDKKKD